MKAKSRLGTPKRKKFVNLTEIESPPASPEARSEIGHLLTALQRGTQLVLPDWKPLTKSIGSGYCELIVKDHKIKKSWRIICYVDDEVVVALEMFHKQTDETPDDVIKLCKNRLRDFQSTHKSSNTTK